MNRLGIDIGRVLIAPDAVDGRADTSFIGGSLEAALATPPYEGMFETVPDLVKSFRRPSLAGVQGRTACPGEDAPVAAPTPLL
jgi:hypothetical protein